MSTNANTMREFYARVYVRFHSGAARTDRVFAPSVVEARLEADSHALALRERDDVENAFRLEPDEPDGPRQWSWAVRDGTTGTWTHDDYDAAHAQLHALLAEVEHLRRDVAKWEAEVADQDDLLIKYALRERTARNAIQSRPKIEAALAENEQLRAALKIATWDLACHTFIGKDISLGEEADRLYAEYAPEAVRG